MDPVSATLLGTKIAATAATATSAATAAATTTGLFGTAGSFALMPALSTLSTGFGLFSAFTGMQAGKAEAKQYANEQIVERSRAAQEEARRQQELTAILNTQSAMNAGRGVAGDSGSALAISNFSQQEAIRDTKTGAFNSAQQISKLRMQQKQAKSGAVGSLLGGLAQTAGAFADRSIAAYERQVT